MKPVIEANFKPFESVRFRQNASLVSKDQLAARQHQAISQYRLKVRQAQNYGISSPESMTCIQDIRQAFNLRDTVQRVHGTANVSGSGNSFCIINFAVIFCINLHDCISLRGSVFIW